MSVKNKELRVELKNISEEYSQDQQEILEALLDRSEEIRLLEEDLEAKTTRLAIVEESLDPKNTRWARVKRVREAVKKTWEDFPSHEKRLNTLQLTTYAAAVVDFSELYDVPVPLILAMTRRESAFDPKATSYTRSGKPLAKGIIQIIDSTAREIGGDLGVRHYSMYKIRDNVRFGVFYIMKMLDEFDGDVSLAVRAYNCGPTYVHKILSGEYQTYPSETREYVRTILGDDTKEGFIRYYEKMGL